MTPQFTRTSASSPSTSHTQMAMVEAVSPPKIRMPVSTPQKAVLKWHPGERGKLVARLTISARNKGVCAILLSFRDYDGRRIMTGGVEGTCIVQSNGKPGQDFHALILYRLEAGNHELSWAMPGDKGALHAEISQINRL